MYKKNRESSRDNDKKNVREKNDFLFSYELRVRYKIKCVTKLMRQI